MAKTGRKRKRPLVEENADHLAGKVLTLPPGAGKTETLIEQVLAHNSGTGKAERRVVVNVRPELAELITEVAELCGIAAWKLLEEIPLKKLLLQRKHDALREKAAQMKAVERELAQLEANEKSEARDR